MAGSRVDSLLRVRRPLAALLLILQLVFAALPGDGVVLCVGGEHGALGLCGDLGSQPSPVALGAPGDPAPGPAEDHGDHRDDCQDCDGVHLTRGALEPWQAAASPVRALHPVSAGAEWPTLAQRPLESFGRRAARHRAYAPRRAPPPTTRALEVVRVTELRI